MKQLSHLFRLFSVQFMNAFPVYPAMGFGTPSLMYSPLMMAPQAPPRQQTQSQAQTKIETENVPAKFQRPASQATSVKAEPGSAIGSMVSDCPHGSLTWLTFCLFHLTS